MNFFEEKEVFVDKIKINSENVQKVREKVLNNFDICEKNIKTLKNKIKKLEDEKIIFLNIIEKRNNAIFFIEKLKEEYKEYNEYYEDRNKINSLLKELKTYSHIKDEYIKNKTYNEYIIKKKELKIKYENIKKENQDKKEALSQELQTLEKPNKQRIVELEKMAQIIDKLFDIDDELNSLEYDEEKSNFIIESETKKLEHMKEKLVLSQKLLSEIDMCYTCPSCKKMLKIRENKLTEYENQDFMGGNTDLLNLYQDQGIENFEIICFKMKNS
jgi:DNA repair exonuclease SbcCD ATPase subunit